MHESQAVPTDVCMSRDDESRLISRAVRGSAEAFRALVEAYQERLFAFVWRIVRNHHEAEDICQAAFVKAYESLASYSRDYAFSTWLFTIGYRLCLNTLRKKKAVATDADLSALGAQAEDVATTLAGSEDARRLRDVIWSAVDQLSAPQKAAVLLFYREGKSCQEIGVVLDMPPVTVKSHLHRARERLRALLSSEWVDAWRDGQRLAGSDSA